jgi:hypothetical protein
VTPPCWIRIPPMTPSAERTETSPGLR